MKLLFLVCATFRTERLTFILGNTFRYYVCLLFLLSGFSVLFKFISYEIPGTVVYDMRSIASNSYKGCGAGFILSGRAIYSQRVGLMPTQDHEEFA